MHKWQVCFFEWNNQDDQKDKVDCFIIEWILSSCLSSHAIINNVSSDGCQLVWCNEIVSVLNNDLKTLENWLNINKLGVNTKKTK